MSDQVSQRDGERWSVAADEKLRKMFHAEARNTCKPVIEKFVECSKREGLKVFFKCREENTAMNACTKAHTTEEEWKIYRQSKIDEYVKQGKVVIPKQYANVDKPY